MPGWYLAPMGGRSRTLLAWSLWLATMGCLLGGLVVTLAVVRPLTTEAIVNGAFEGSFGCCSPPSAWS